MNARRWYIGAVLTVALTLGLGRPARAQTDEDHFQTLPFNFSNPGARPTAMGGAFIGLADDASAAVANPAGLTSLRVRPQQVYFEYKHSIAPVAALDRPNSLLTGFGRLVGTPRDLPAFVDYATRLTKDGAKRAVTIAFSRHEFLNYKNSFQLPARRGIIITVPVFPDLQATTDLQAASYSGSVGFVMIPTAVGRNPKLRGGFSVSVNRLRADIVSLRGEGTRAIDRCLPNPCAAIPSTETHSTSIASGLTAGLLFQAHANLSVGLLYAYEPHFKIEQHIIQTAKNNTFCAVAGCSSASLTPSWNVPMKTPSRLGVGLGYSHERMKAVFDAVRVGYGSLVDPQELVQFRHIADSYARIAGVDSAKEQAALNTSAFRIDNTVELRGGVEYSVLPSTSSGKALFLRYGAFYRPTHSVRYEDSTCGPNPDEKGFRCNLVASFYYAQKRTALVEPADPNDPPNLDNGLSSVVALLSPERGFSFGAGVNLSTLVQIDAAFSASTYRQKEFVLSTTFRFNLHK